MRKHAAVLLTIGVSLIGCSKEMPQAPAVHPAAAPQPVQVAAAPALPTTPEPAPPGLATSGLDAKSVTQCASDSNTVNRLACFDELARKNGLAPNTETTTETAAGKWITSTDTDPLTDKSVYFASLDADDGRGKFGDEITLIVRCKNGKTDAYINWRSYLGSDGTMVTSRIDKASATKAYWSLSTDSKASFMPQPVATLKKFAGASTYVANLTPYSESPITAIFNISGSEVAFKDIRGGCKW